MKKLIIIPLFALIAGCVGATPIDFLIPTKKPTPATQEYLGHLYPTNYVNGFYHSLSDTKYQKVLVPLREAELKGLQIVANGELDFIESVGDTTSNVLWGAVVAGAGALGLFTDKPGTKARIAQAKAEDPSA